MFKYHCIESIFALTIHLSTVIDAKIFNAFNKLVKYHKEQNKTHKKHAENW